MNARRLQKIKARLSAASPGPWQYFTNHGHSRAMWTDATFMYELFGSGCPDRKANIELLKHLHEDMAALIEAVEGLK